MERPRVNFWVTLSLPFFYDLHNPLILFSARLTNLPSLRSEQRQTPLVGLFTSSDLLRWPDIWNESSRTSDVRPFFRKPPTSSHPYISRAKHGMILALIRRPARTLCDNASIYQRDNSDPKTWINPTDGDPEQPRKSSSVLFHTHKHTHSLCNV